MYPNTTPHPIGRTVVADGRTFIAQAWIGAKASAEARATLAQIVSSLSFPRLRVSQTVGYGYRVLLCPRFRKVRFLESGDLDD